MDIVIPKSAGFVADFQNHTHLPNGHAQQQKLRFCSPTANSVIFIYGEMDNATTAFQILLSITCYAIVFWKSANKAQPFLAIINQLLSVDQELQQYPRAPAALENKCDFYKGYLLMLLAHISTFWSMKWMNSHECNSSMICVCIFFIYLYMHAVINAYVVFVAILLHLLTMRFRYLNSFIGIYAAKRNAVGCAGVSTQCGDGTWAGCGGERTAEDVDFVVFSQDMIFFYRLHNHLLVIFETLNDYVHIALLVFIGYFLYGSTIAVYYFYFAAILRDDIQIISVIWCALFLCLHGPTAAVLMRKSDAAAKEANATSCHLARIYGRGLDQQKLICSAITTYLVILIQFRQLEDSRAQNSKHRATDEL
ncbi:gustatory and pheromone receptor 32a-like [Ceratitis capitata]|uniref:gustatory and pheromone receptor 32a-like n=1 Tax=Ceratitis capitata TaxID=7213 RepID=UPI00032A2BAF|nr:gustatory and pheromone receptor 32a-like [Ceratitis capitata]